jgi:phage anti-repressor protein
MQLSIQSVNSLLQNTEPYPVDFDDAWRWVGYSRKDNALTRLKASLEEGFDFSCEFRKIKPGAGRPEEKYFLTVEAFKMFAMLAETPQGREVRKYFIECERRLKEILIQQSIEPAPARENRDYWQGKVLSSARNLQLATPAHERRDQIRQALSYWYNVRVRNLVELVSAYLPDRGEKARFMNAIYLADTSVHEMLKTRDDAQAAVIAIESALQQFSATTDWLVSNVDDEPYDACCAAIELLEDTFKTCRDQARQLVYDHYPSLREWALSPVPQARQGLPSRACEVPADSHGPTN